MLPAVIGAISGLLGVILGCLLGPWLTTRWARRNWQLQKVTEAYADLFVQGLRETRLLENAEVWPLEFDNPKDAYSTISRITSGESVFLQKLEECWLLEKDGTLRKSLEHILHSFEQYSLQIFKNTIKDRLSWEYQGKPKEFHEKSLQKASAIADHLGSVGLRNQITDLRKNLAKKYFH